ncbi:uncharacterized protein LOC120174783 [Hibiscus syriacus]|uniref:uncharacterized protein LOC120174783 n=1 Tax=Hibiscus syriacus TaxID=106335 RepID=UPI00192110E6|nr:uncharacterized protein LOC120174783 [Hibiscus syriacus]
MEAGMEYVAGNLGKFIAKGIDKCVAQDEVQESRASEILNKNKHSLETSNSTSESDDMVGNMASGVIQGSFDAGYLLNVKIHVQKKRDPFPLRGHLLPVSPTSGKTEKPIEHKNGTPKLPDQGIDIRLQSSATAANGSQSSSSLIPPASNSLINDTSLPLGQEPARPHPDCRMVNLLDLKPSNR